jgi:uncharacterized protein (TIGR03118 family)
VLCVATIIVFLINYGEIIMFKSHTFFDWRYALSFLVIAALVSCKSTSTNPPPTTPSTPYTETVLVADIAGTGAAFIDTTLKNEWGMSVGSTGTWWLSSNVGRVTNIYDYTGKPVSPLNPVIIPSRGNATGGTPTGVIFNGTTDFKGAHFIYCSLDGIISAWLGGGSATVEATDPSTNAVYTGMALASNGGANYLYVADDKENKIVVYDKNFAPVTLGAGTFPGKFIDNASPAIPSTAAPYNIAYIGGQIYVAYSTFSMGAVAGNGYISVFNTDGSFVKRLASGGTLNQPWGMAIAPSTFGPFKNATLIGNFGDGTINGYDASGNYIGQLSKDSTNDPLKIDGLWGLTVTSTGKNDSTAVYFTAGPGGEQHGLFGYIKPKQ